MSNLETLESVTIYEAIGGQSVIDRVVDSLYQNVAKHDTLIPLFPGDLTNIAYKQRLFLTQFFGGPSLYLTENVHPILNSRHASFKITLEHRNAWLECMDNALADTKVEKTYRAAIIERLSLTATNMINEEN